ncbi:MAG: putative lipoprotein, partial [Phenylobacterium sp.]
MQPGFKEELRLKHLLFIGMIGLVAGCSSSEEREVSDDHQYLNSVEGKVIKVPQGFEKPVGSN